jgi:hypothetical protein
MWSIHQHRHAPSQQSDATILLEVVVPSLVWSCYRDACASVDALSHIAVACSSRSEATSCTAGRHAASMHAGAGARTLVMMLDVPGEQLIETLFDLRPRRNACLLLGADFPR